jgi:predicted dehydrogenase
LSERLTRRSFLETAAAAGVVAAVGGSALSGSAQGAAPASTGAGAGAGKPKAATASAPATTQARKLNIGIIGVGGRGMDHVREINAIANANIIAVCDVDALNLVNAARVITQAQPFVDFRDLLKAPNLDAVVVATPDHNHAPITAAALHAGKHVSCEQPLTHTICEARAITELAHQTGKVTQLGIQIHAMDNYRRVVEWVQSGAIGPVREVHVWNNRTHQDLNNEQVPPPPSLNYELWLGPVPERPYHASYHPFNWRQYWAFGEGMLGDIGCHLMDVAFWALDLKYPKTVSAQGAPMSDEFCPKWNIVTYEFDARSGSQPAVKLTWYDPPKTPPMLSSWKLDPKFTEGVMFIGDEGMVFTNYGEHVLLPEEKFKGVAPPPKRIPSSPGHQAEWINACLSNDPAATSAPFSYGGPLSETALLGLLAYRAGAGRVFEWDAMNMKFPHAPEAEKFLSYDYRGGWGL